MKEVPISDPIYIGSYSYVNWIWNWNLLHIHWFGSNSLIFWLNINWIWNWNLIHIHWFGPNFLIFFVAGGSKNVFPIFSEIASQRIKGSEQKIRKLGPNQSIWRRFQFRTQFIFNKNNRKLDPNQWKWRRFQFQIQFIFRAEN